MDLDRSPWIPMGQDGSHGSGWVPMGPDDHDKELEGQLGGEVKETTQLFNIGHLIS